MVQQLGGQEAGGAGRVGGGPRSGCSSTGWRGGGSRGGGPRGLEEPEGVLPLSAELLTGPRARAQQVFEEGHVPSLPILLLRPEL